METALIRVRMSEQDIHYGGSLVEGSKILQLFGDLATELLIKNDGDEGLFLTYEDVQFLHPIYSGDFIEAKAEIIHIGNSSRKIKFKAFIVIKSRSDINDSAADFLIDPILVSEAKGVCVVKKEKQRKKIGSEED